MNKYDKNFKGRSIPSGVGLGLLVMYIIALPLSLLGSVFINYEYLDIISTSVIGVIITLLAVLVGSVVVLNIVPNRKTIAAISVSGIYVILNICIAALFFELSGRGVATLLVSVLVGTVSAFFVKKLGNNSGKKRYRNMHSR